MIKGTWADVHVEAVLKGVDGQQLAPKVPIKDRFQGTLTIEEVLG